MTDNQYPWYADGQTLTSTELNTTTAFLKRQDQLLGHSIGFGVNAGLTGTIEGSGGGAHLTITSGLAVDQSGEVLALLEDQDVTIAASDPAPSYDFVDGAVDGFSIVLEATETAPPPQPCTQQGCGGHPSMHVTDVAVRVVAGRLTGAWLDFSGEPLLTVTPMALSVESSPVGSFAALRDAVAARLSHSGQPEISAALINQLKATSIGAGDLPGVKGYKCGWLNMVLFATLDLLRCEDLLALSWDHTTTRDGVVLGWVHQQAGDWVFDCTYRHAWEPPRGFTEAFLGGTCADPAALYRERIESVIANYAPPDPPPPGGGGGPTVDHCRHFEVKYKDCFVVPLPPKIVPDDWGEWWKGGVIKDPKVPIWNPPDFIDPVDVYQNDGFDQLRDGYVHAGGVLGHPVDAVTDVLTQTAKDAGITANVLVKQASELDQLSGYAPTEGFSPSDTMVLTVGADQQTVIGVGRISALQTSREVGTALPSALDAADRATQAAAGIQQTVAGFETKLGELDTRVATFGSGVESLRGEFEAYSGGKFDQPSFETRLSNLETQVKGVSDLGDRITKVEGGISVITASKGGLGGRVLDPGLATGISQFAATTVDAMKSLGQVDNQNFQRYVSAADKAVTDLDAAAQEQDPAAVTTATINTLSTLRTAVKASGVSDDLGKQLDAHIRNLQGLVG